MSLGRCLYLESPARRCRKRGDEIKLKIIKLKIKIIKAFYLIISDLIGPDAAPFTSFIYC